MKKKNNNIQVDANFSAVLPKPIEVPSLIDVKSYNGKYVKWGDNNKLPQQLYTYFLEVSNLQSILLTYKDFICGKGIESDFNRLNSDLETIQDVITKAVEDYTIFGCFALECIRNAHGEVANVIYQDVRNVRVNEEMTIAYLASEWGQFNSKNSIELPLWNKNEKTDHFIFFYNGNSRGWYGTPVYFAALKSIEILRQTRNFHLNNLTNGFSANAIITFCNGIPSKTVQDETFKKLNEQYCGTDNTSRLFINYADNKDNAPKVERLQSDQFGELYKALSESSVDDIYQACRINKMLLGANVQTGFSKEEISEAARLFNKTVIYPIQDKIEHAIAKLGINIHFEKYNFED